MRALVLSIIASVFVAGAFYLSSMKKETNTQASVEELRWSTSANGVIESKYANLQDQSPESMRRERLMFEFDKLEDKINEDYLGVISIPDLGTHEAVYKSEGDYYLDYDRNGKKSDAGEVYLDDRSTLSMLSNGALLNGHAMPNGTKFGKFKELLDLGKSPEIVVWSAREQTFQFYEALFVSLVDGRNSGLRMKFKDEADRLSYYKDLYATSIKQWIEPQEGEEYIILNSCSYIIKDGRYLVIARKVTSK